MSQYIPTVLLLTASNVFMTFAWYGHLRMLNDRPWIIAAFISWGIALFEYLLQVPANRMGAAVAPVSHLKIIQEIISLAVFVPFSIWFLDTPLSWNYLWAGFCLVGAVYFIFTA